MCRCGHELGFHNPCSICACPAFEAGKRKKFERRDVGTTNPARALITAELEKALASLRAEDGE